MNIITPAAANTAEGSGTVAGGRLAWPLLESSVCQGIHKISRRKIPNTVPVAGGPGGIQGHIIFKLTAFKYGNQIGAVEFSI